MTARTVVPASIGVSKVLADSGEFFYMVRVDERLIAALSTTEAWELLAQLANAMHQEDGEWKAVERARKLLATR